MRRHVSCHEKKKSSLYPCLNKTSWVVNCVSYKRPMNDCKMPMTMWESAWSLNMAPHLIPWSKLIVKMVQVHPHRPHRLWATSKGGQCWLIIFYLWTSPQMSQSIDVNLLEIMWVSTHQQLHQTTATVHSALPLIAHHHPVVRVPTLS